MRIVGNLGNIYMGKAGVKYGDGSFDLHSYHTERKYLRLYLGYRNYSLYLGIL